MKITVYILMPDNSIIRQRVKNPTTEIKLRYKVNNINNIFTYKFKREALLSLKRFLGFEKVIIYKHDQSEPLGINFKEKDNTQEEINRFLESGLFEELVKSSKDKKAEMSLKLVLGALAIIGLVCIVVFG